MATQQKQPAPPAPGVLPEAPTPEKLGAEEEKYKAIRDMSDELDRLSKQNRNSLSRKQRRFLKQATKDLPKPKSVAFK